MKLWIAYNGYQGYNWVHVLVIAEDQERARAAAVLAFRQSDEAARFPEGPKYWAAVGPPTLLCDDTSQAWSGRVSD